MKKFDGWMLKNRRGSLLMWSISWLRKDVIEKINKFDDNRWKDLRKDGCKIVKVRMVEVKD